MSKLSLTFSLSSLFIGIVAIFVYNLFNGYPIINSTIHANENEASKDSSICSFTQHLCPKYDNYSKLLDCFDKNNIEVYYLKMNQQCTHCSLTPGIIFPLSTDQTSVVVRCFSENPQVPFRVRSGAHSFHGTSFVDHGFIIDMVNMRKFTVTEDRKQVTIGVGFRVGEVYAALEKYDLLLIGGDCPDVGIGGLSSTGGTGFTTRKFGVMVNTVENYEIVLASGRVINASFAENRDLFDVLRGTGASSFGVTTQVTFNVEKLEKSYGFIKIVIDTNSLANWMQLFLKLSKEITEDVMYLYTYIFKDFIIVQGAVTGNTFSNFGDFQSLKMLLRNKTKEYSVRVLSDRFTSIKYSELYENTYGQGAFDKSLTLKSTWRRDFREKEDREYEGIMSGYICTEKLPMEVLERIQKLYYKNPKYLNAFHYSDFGTNIELFGGKQFPEERYGVYKGKNCSAIFTTYPKRVSDKKKQELILSFQNELWDILRPYTNFSYRGYEDMSEGKTVSSEGSDMMTFNFGDTKYQVMEAKSKYDPGNLFKHNLSIPTLECYNNKQNC